MNNFHRDSENRKDNDLYDKNFELEQELQKKNNIIISL
jgi:hypothetical protein